MNWRKNQTNSRLIWPTENSPETSACDWGRLGIQGCGHFRILGVSSAGGRTQSQRMEATEKSCDRRERARRRNGKKELQVDTEALGSQQLIFCGSTARAILPI